MHIRKSNGPKKEPCGTPNSIDEQLEHWPLSTTPWNLLRKGALSGLRQYLETVSLSKCFLFHLKNSFRFHMENAFYLTSKALFVVKIFKFLSWVFGHVAKRLDKKD